MSRVEIYISQIICCKYLFKYPVINPNNYLSDGQYAGITMNVNNILQQKIRHLEILFKIIDSKFILENECTSVITKKIMVHR